jgi:ferredoxin
MADRNDKWGDNVKGKFYVDRQCIDCDLCREIAPKFFKQSLEGGHSIVYKQPKEDSEIKICNEALESCPVNAIGSDEDDN